jgi:predicted nucleic acid-binding protein
VKIVLDTTILVRANERSHGLARELLLNVVESKHTLLLSNEMLHELARILRYPRLQAFYDLTENLVFDYQFSPPSRGTCGTESSRSFAHP